MARGFHVGSVKVHRICACRCMCRGDFFDEGTGTARWTGQYEETALGREEGIIGKGSKSSKYQR
ncbi:MAG: hypothetical protein R2822_24375 [Spirosomataceae bacterium]